MNPEENQNNQGDAAATLNSALAPEVPAPETTPAETPAAEETPSLDQVAADLTNTTPESLATPEISAPETSVPQPTPTPEGLTAEAPTTPEAPAVPENPVTTETLTSEAATAPEVAPVATPVTPVTPEAPIVPESPLASETTTETSTATSVDLSTPASTTPVDLSTPTTPESSSIETPAGTTEAQPDLSTDFTSETTPSSASFVGDAPESSKPTDTEDDEEPLKPADPVPGSIGSALAYSDSTPDHSTPVIKPKKTPMFDFKGNARLIIMIVAAVVLVAIVVIVLLFVMNSTSGNKSSTNKNNNSNNSANVKPNQPVVSSLICTLSGDGSKFQGYGNVTSGEENVIARYSDDALTSLGTNITLNYSSEDDANTGRTAAEQNYKTKYTQLNLTADPFLSTYDVTGNTVTVTHQADGEAITTSNAKVMDLYVLRGEVISDMETLKDTFQTDGFTCVEK